VTHARSADDGMSNTVSSVENITYMFTLMTHKVIHMCYETISRKKPIDTL
jgi:hypothetical protein